MSLRNPLPHGERGKDLFPQPGHALRLILGDQCVDHFPQTAALQYLGQLVQRQIDPVVGHPALREIIRSNSLRPVARADHGLPRLGLGPGCFLALHFVHPRAKHLHRLFLVLVLAAPVLTGDDDAGRQMRDTHGGIGRVHMLPASARSPVDVDFQVARLDVDIDFGRFG